MEVQIDSELFFEITESQKDILRNDLESETLDDDLKRRIKWVIDHKVDQCYERLKNEWIPILEADPEVETIPLDRDQFVSLVLARPEYLNKSERMAQGLS